MKEVEGVIDGLAYVIYIDESDNQILSGIIDGVVFYFKDFHQIGFKGKGSFTIKRHKAVLSLLKTI